MNNYLMSMFANSFEKRSDKPFIQIPGGKTYTYGETYHLSGQIAAVLNNISVSKGDRVAVYVDKCPETIMLYLACARIGAIYLPLNMGYTENELNYFIEDATPKVFVCRPDKIEVAARVAKQCDAVLTLAAEQGSLFEQAKRSDPITANVTCDKDDLVAILYTSGTTGCSKGAMLSHGNLASNAVALSKYWHFDSDDQLIHALPVYHTHGLFVACNVTLVSGCAMYFLRKFDVEAILDLIPTSTSLMGVPTFYTRLLKTKRLNADYVKHMRLFISGSAPLKKEVHDAFYERTQHKILERYGMTETNMNISNPYKGERIAGTVGFPLPGVKLRITSRETGAELPSGEIGNIELKGNNVFTGYWRMPDKTKEAFTHDGYFTTGDLGKIDEKGYVHIMGRDKDLVISGGYNIYPKEVEIEIDKMTGVLESAVIGIAHPDLGEGVTAVVVRQGESEISEAAIIQALADRLARYKRPKRILFVPELPRNVMGKMQKNVLRKTYAALYQ